MARFAHRLSAKLQRGQHLPTLQKLLGLIGCWPGALIAQRFLRHKTIKLSFQVIFWMTVVLNCSALVWMTTPAGKTLLAEVTLALGAIVE